MQTQAPTFRRLVVLLVVAAISVLMTFAAWELFEGPTPLAPHSYRFTVPIEDASTMYPGSDVRTAGVKIGRVTQIETVRNQPVATIELEPRFAPIRSRATVIPRTKSLLGEGYIELAPGPESAAPIPENGQLARAQVHDAQTLDQVLQIFNPATRRAIQRTFAGLATGLEGRGQDVSDTLGAVAPFTANLGELTAVVDGQRRELQQLIANSGDVLAAIGARQADVRSAVEAGDRLLSTTAGRNRELAATIRALPPFLRTLRRSGVQLEGTSAELTAGVAALRPSAPLVLPALREIDRAAPQYGGTLRDLSPLLSAGNRGLPAATSVVDSVGKSFAPIYPSLRELNPTVQLLAAVREGLLSLTANVGNTANGGVPGTNGELTTGPSAIPTIWNESVAGWKRKLPTSLPNPYPKPGSARHIGQGFLQSLDCRHTKNPLYLPALFSSPPCLEQGPWSFQGNTRYYPRVSEAAP